MRRKVFLPQWPGVMHTATTTACRRYLLYRKSYDGVMKTASPAPENKQDDPRPCWLEPRAGADHSFVDWPKLLQPLHDVCPPV